jgi:hypothetical protein
LALLHAETDLQIVQEITSVRGLGFKKAGLFDTQELQLAEGLGDLVLQNNWFALNQDWCSLPDIE